MIMKKLVKVFVLAAISLVATKSFANDSTAYAPNFKVWSAESGKYNVLYRSATKESVKIKFLNEKRRVLYTEWVRSSKGFVKPFDLNQLPKGTYTIELVSNEQVLQESIKLYSAKELYDQMIQISELDEQKVKVDVDTKAGDEVDVFIMNDEGGVIYNESTSESKVYNLSNVDLKEVTVLIYKNGEVIKTTDIKL